MSDGIERRTFIRRAAEVAGAAVAGLASCRQEAQETAAEPAEPTPIAQSGTIPTRVLGRTGLELPVLGFGGAALVQEWGNRLSVEERVELVRYAYDQGVRYFDTAGNYLESQAILGEGLEGIRDDVCLVTKIETTEPDEVRPAFEKSLRELRTDHIDILEIHGTPGLEQMSVERAMEVHAEIVKLRDEGAVRHIGFSAHSYFDKGLALIESGGFDQCMLSYGYLPRGYDQVFSAGMTELRNCCVAKAGELGLGIAAMKVMGAGLLGAGVAYVVPDLEERHKKALPGAAIRWALQDERVHLLVIGMRLKEEVDANIEVLAGDTTLTNDDRGLLAGISAATLYGPAMKDMRVD